jgi:hypothetical protein
MFLKSGGNLYALSALGYARDIDGDPAPSSTLRCLGSA